MKVRSPDDNGHSRLVNYQEGGNVKKQQRYTPEFRAEAVKLVVEQGLSQETAANHLAIPKGTPGNWVVGSVHC